MNRGTDLLLPPELVLSAVPKGLGCGGMNDHELYRFAPPSMASTMLRKESAANRLWTSRTNG